MISGCFCLSEPGQLHLTMECALYMPTYQYQCGHLHGRTDRHTSTERVVGEADVLSVSILTRVHVLQ